MIFVRRSGRINQSSIVTLAMDSEGRGHGIQELRDREGGDGYGGAGAGCLIWTSIARNMKNFVRLIPFLFFGLYGRKEIEEHVKGQRSKIG